MLVYGQALRIPLDIELNHILHQEHRSPTDSSFVFTHALALERAREQAHQYMDRYKQKYDLAPPDQLLKQWRFTAPPALAITKAVADFILLDGHHASIV